MTTPRTALRLAGCFPLLAMACLSAPNAPSETPANAPPPLPAVTSATPARAGWKALDPAIHCAAVSDVALCTRIIDMNNRDQEVRYRWIADRENETLQAEVTAVDEANMRELAAIIATHGWPGTTLVGKRASGGAWTVIQHADIETIRTYLPIMQSAVSAGELDGALLATTVDRVRVADGQPQVYGTQFREVAGELVPHPIEDEANVDQRRAAVGLGTLAEYTTMMRQMYRKNP